jgi:hypothetical protein
MLNRILSNDYPRSKLLAALLLAAAAGPGVRAVHLSRRQGAVGGRQGAGVHRAGGQL